MKRTYLILTTSIIVLCLQCSFSFGQTEANHSISLENSGSRNEAARIPEPPVFQNTGNPSADSSKYQVAKEVWISDCVAMIESHLGQMEPLKKEKFMNALRAVDIEAARNGDYTLPIIANPYSENGEVELH